LQHDLRRAIWNRELEIFYQPQVSLLTGMMRGVEALLRWRHPVLGLIAPALFLPLAEESGAIVEMGQWVINEVCRQAAEWLEPGIGSTISVNVSCKQLRSPEFFAGILTATSRHGVPVDALELEVTEPLNHSEGCIKRLEALRESGVRIALDHYGTRSSKLQSFSGLPLDVVKLDRNVIRHVDHDLHSYNSVGEIINRASELGLETVAGGIERKEQAERLAALGCRLGQGNFYSNPCPIHRLEFWMEGRV
jgi:EAL domain-containing protein (putative c-di-GMP-specific phosphodiesterase class I)